MTRPDTVFFHAKDSLLLSANAGKLDFVNLVSDICRSAGYKVSILNSSGPDEELRTDTRHIHILMNDRPCYGPNTFACVPSYLRGFWYFDELATRNNSSIRLKEFRPDLVRGGAAEKFFKRLGQKFIGQNLSKYPQDDGTSDIVTGCISLFLQDFAAPKFHRHYVGAIDMIEAAIACRGHRHLYIKPHPLQPDDQLAQIAAYHDPQRGVTVGDAGIHCLLPKSDLAISQSSAACFEAYLHKTPVILCGQTDFHHIAITLLDARRMAQAMDDALSAEIAYEKYLFWFLKQNLIEPRQQANARQRIVRVFHNKGYLSGLSGSS
jgi:hypothetical protein